MPMCDVNNKRIATGAHQLLRTLHTIFYPDCRTHQKLSLCVFRGMYVLACFPKIGRGYEAGQAISRRYNREFLNFMLVKKTESARLGDSLFTHHKPRARRHEF